MGLLGDLSALSAAGDGTPVVTSAYPDANRLASIVPSAKLIATILVFTPSKAATRAGSAKEEYLDTHLYMLSAADSKHDLPLYPRLQPAKRHDTVSLDRSTIEFQQLFSLKHGGQNASRRRS